MNSATHEWEDASNRAPEMFILRLYVSGMTPRSERAITALQEICEKHLHGRYSLEILDITQNRADLERDEVIAAPTLVKARPLPLRRLVGDFSQLDRVLAGLGVV